MKKSSLIWLLHQRGDWMHGMRSTEYGSPACRKMLLVTSTEFVPITGCRQAAQEQIGNLCSYRWVATFAEVEWFWKKKKKVFPHYSKFCCCMLLVFRNSLFCENGLIKNMGLFHGRRNRVSLSMEFILVFWCSYFLDSLSVLISVLPVCTALKLALSDLSLTCDSVVSVFLQGFYPWASLYVVHSVSVLWIIRRSLNYKWEFWSQVLVLEILMKEAFVSTEVLT